MATGVKNPAGACLVSAAIALWIHRYAQNDSHLDLYCIYRRSAQNFMLRSQQACALRCHDHSMFIMGRQCSVASTNRPAIAFEIRARTARRDKRLNGKNQTFRQNCIAA